MSVAARVAHWLQKPGGWRSPVSGGFTADEVHPCVELFLGGEWVDISSYVYYRDMINITRGRSSEASQLDPSTCTFTVNNRDGRFAPRNPTGAYYGLIGRNTPVRVSVTRNGVRWYRFYGEVSGWQPQADISGDDAYVQVEAAGILRRLSQGETPLKSPIYRSIMQLGTRNDYRDYWPCEDQSGATNMASAIDGGIPMTYSGAKPTFASYEGFNCSAPVLVLGATSLTARVNPYTPGSAQIARVLMRLPDSVGSTQSLMKVTCEGSLTYWEVLINTSAQLNFVVTASDGTTAYSSGFLDYDASFGENCSLAFRMTQSGSDVIPLFIIAHLDGITSYSPVSITNNQATTTISSTTFGRITSITIGEDLGISTAAVGHLVVNNSDLFYGELSSLGPDGTSANVSALLGNCGENPAARIHRLCNEEEISFISPTDIDDTVGMGFQRVQNLTDLFRECADTSLGLLYEPRDQIGIGFLPRQTLYNKEPALTLDNDNHELSSQLIPVDDDRSIFNDVVVTSTSDTSARVTLDEGAMSTQAPPDGVGRYDTSITVNQVANGFQNAVVTNADASLENLAGWKLHEGTVDEPRYPQISVNLRHPTFTESVGNMNSALTLDVGSVLHVENPPAWSPQETVRTLIQGYTETLGAFEHDITFNTSPMSVWDVAVSDDSDARADTDGTEMLTSISSSATSVPVKITDGQIWTVDPAQFPMDVKAAGEIMTASAITSHASDAFGRSESGAWGTADSGQAWFVVGGTVGTDFAVGSGYGQHILTTTNVSRRSGIDFTYPDVDVYVSVTTSAAALTASLYGGPVVRYIDANNLYMLRIEFTTANAILLDLRKRVDGTESSIGTYTTPLTHVAGTFVRARLQARGSVIRTKVWALTATEPDWQITVTDTDITTSTFIGCRSISASTNSNVNPQIRYDNYEIVNPQVMTVTRAVNGVVKEHTAGTDIRLANPTITAL